MNFVINLALLILGTTGGLAAFGGETWKKGFEPIARRVTVRGWIALTCMLATLALGIAKEVRSSAATGRSAARQYELEEMLAKTSAELSATRAKLAAIEPNLLQAMILTTAGIRKESDFSTPTLNGQSSLALISGRTGAPLALYGGDLVDYHVFCSGGSHRIAGFPTSDPLHAPHLTLRVGNTDYPLSAQGHQMIIGPVGQPMQAVLINPNFVTECNLKILVESADRSREAKQIEPLLKMIQDARRPQ